jgi:hypothetical protein
LQQYACISTVYAVPAATVINGPTKPLKALKQHLQYIGVQVDTAKIDFPFALPNFSIDHRL